MKDLESQLQQAIEAHRNGDIGHAEPVYRRVLAEDPDHAEALHMMGVVHLQREKAAEAEQEVRRAISVNGNNAIYFNTLGNVLSFQNRLSEALGAFESALERDPDCTNAAYNKGTVLLSMGRYRDAEAVFRGALDSGDDVSLVNNLATTLIKQNRIREAVDCCREGLERFSGHPALSANLAAGLELSNDLEAAKEIIWRVYVDFPDFFMARQILARVLRRQNRPGEALEILNPLFVHAMAPVDKIEAYHEKGFILDALGSHADAFKSISISNDLLSKSPEAERFDGEKFFRHVKSFSNWLDVHSFTGSDRSPDGARSPVFFVGFPRSGTTLMEQVLMAHPGIVTTEEDSPLVAVESHAQLQAKRLGTAYPECLDDWENERLEELQRIFWTKAESINGSTPESLLVDKLPLNITLVGMVKRIFPEARFIVALRDPRDVCLSCFFQKFKLNNAMVNFLDLKKTGILYAEVMGLWLRYREDPSLLYIEYRYEDLVDDLENTVRRVLEFIGADWHDDISNYRAAAKQRVIRTPSYREVTVPVHKKAIRRWKGYENELAPIIPLLEPFIEAFGYES